MNTLILSLSILLLGTNSMTDSCQSINIGIQSEKVLTYSIHESDTTLERTTLLNFNELGFTVKAISFSETQPDTQVTIMEYDDNKIIGWKEFITGYNDTTVYQAITWNDGGRGTKFDKLGEEGSYVLYEYENCVAIRKKTYSGNELIYSIDYQWNENLLQKTTSQFFGSLQEAIGKSTSITESNFESFDEKRNWIKRSFTNDDGKHLELRYLRYY